MGKMKVTENDNSGMSTYNGKTMSASVPAVLTHILDDFSDHFGVDSNVHCGVSLNDPALLKFQDKFRVTGEADSDKCIEVLLHRQSHLGADPKLIICLPFTPAEQHLLKITTSHFSTLIMQIANQYMLERILIAM